MGHFPPAPTLWLGRTMYSRTCTYIMVWYGLLLGLPVWCWYQWEPVPSLPYITIYSFIIDGFSSFPKWEWLRVLQPFSPLESIDSSPLLCLINTERWMWLHILQWARNFSEWAVFRPSLRRILSRLFAIAPTSCISWFISTGTSELIVPSRTVRANDCSIVSLTGMREFAKNNKTDLLLLFHPDRHYRCYVVLMLMWYDTLLDPHNSTCWETSKCFCPKQISHAKFSEIMCGMANVFRDEGVVWWGSSFSLLHTIAFMIYFLTWRLIKSQC